MLCARRLRLAIDSVARPAKGAVRRRRRSTANAVSAINVAMSEPLDPGYEAYPMRFTRSTRLAVAKSVLWPAIAGMAGVNIELTPWLQMTVPPDARDKSVEDAPIGERAFTSIILLFGCLPVDLHFVRLVAVSPGSGFVELSSTLVNAVWRHERFITPGPDDDTCELTDRIAFRSRLPGLDRLLFPIIGALFAHRHRQLLARYGRVEPPISPGAIG